VSTEILLRIGVAFAAGVLLGIERESHGRAAGLRTTTLVCVASCLAMILSVTFYTQSFDILGTGSGWRPDPARLAAGVLTGIGFIGAGVIVRQQQVIRGVTTAAVIWFATIIGLVLGTGAIALGLTGVALAMATLLVLPLIERYVQNDWYSALSVTVQADAGASLDQLIEALEKQRVSLKSVTLEHDLTANTRRMSGQVKYKKGEFIALPKKLSEELTQLPGVLKIEWR
jgi:putative Mg2+ transporter-C (MgtC) family protein